MIEVDISNIWGEVSLPDLLAIEKEVFDAHMKLTDRNGEGSDYLGWLDLPVETQTEEIGRIRSAAKRIRETSDVFVVVGIGGSYLGPRAAIELLQGCNRNMGKGKGDPAIFFAGNTLSTPAFTELTKLLEGKDFSLCLISKSGTTTEPAIATRALSWLLERRYGTEEAKKRVFAITDPVQGALRAMAEEAGWESFRIPQNVGGRYSVLTAVGLLPMAVAGIDPMEVLAGAAQAQKDYDLRSFENPLWLYTATRNLLHRNGKDIELLATFEPGAKMLGAWWQQLFGESEGKDGKGLFPATAEYTADLHSLGQLVQQGKRNLFETMLRFDGPETDHIIGSDYRDLDGLNYLQGKSLSFVDEQAYRGTLEAHVDGGVPVVTLEAGKLDARKLGEVFYFFELSCAVSAYILGVNPFNQPGVEAYKHNMFTLLGKPGYEN